jgi:hypothetical protein
MRDGLGLFWWGFRVFGRTGDFVEELGGLRAGSGGDDGEGTGIGEGVVEGSDGGSGGLSPLARAADEDAAGVGLEDLGLGWVEGELEVLCCEVVGAGWDFASIGH